MFKKALFITLLFFIALPIQAEPTLRGMEDGNEKNEAVKEENFAPPINNNYQEENEVYPDYADDEDIVIPASQAKPTKNYAKIYNDLEEADFSYHHDIDPEQYYDMKDATWAPYPLIRLTSAIYFKSRTIEPGYYLLTPREYQGNWYMLFKQNGCVKHIIPVYERDYTPETFYDENIPKPKLKPMQKLHMKGLEFLGNFKSTKRKEQIQCYMEINDVENYFLSIIIYYGAHKYYTIFRTIRL